MGYQTPNRTRRLILGSAFALTLLLTGAVALSSGFSNPEIAHETRELWVDIRLGDDENSGAEADPLKTISEALERAIEQRENGFSTHVKILPGEYREAITHRSFASGGALITLEAVGEGVVVTGADVFTEWSCSVDLCAHPWTFDWGTARNPWEGTVEIGELARRREVVVVDGSNMEQVLSQGDLVSGSFFVNEDEDLLYLNLPAGVDAATATIEVAVRPVLFRVQGVDNLILDGLTFRYAATPFRSPAVDIVDQSNVKLENVDIEWNGQSGLWLRGDRITLTNLTINHNGADGMAGYDVRHMIVEDSETSYNNWRGFRGGYFEWEVGNKFLRVNDLTIRRHATVDNQMRGLWFDSDARDVTIEELYACNNRGDGVKFEKVQGPIIVSESTFCNNSGSGVYALSVHNLTLVDNEFVENHRGLRIQGGFDNVIQDFVTGDEYVLNGENFSVLNNTFRATGDKYLISFTLTGPKKEHFMATSSFTFNEYMQPDNERAFEMPGYPLNRASFEEWLEETDSELGSSFGR